MAPKHKVVILGGGFGGLAAAQKLKRASVEVTLIDRRNYNLFVPLLYPVATAALSPADIARPIRRILSRHRNITVRLGEVVRPWLLSRRSSVTFSNVVGNLVIEKTMDSMVIVIYILAGLLTTSNLPA